MSINTLYTPGRLGNHFFRNMVASIIAEKYNLKVIYSDICNFEKLNIPLYSGLSEYLENPTIIDESNFMDYIIDEKIINFNIILNSYYQTKDFCIYLRDYFNKKYRNYYNNQNPYYFNKINNSLFIHIRLGDIENYNPGYKYYSDLIKNINYDIGYITTDTPEHPIILALLYEYNLKIINNTNLEDIILFGSTCKNIILSNGTFSWMIGFLSDNSIVHYPKIKEVWHGDIFVYDDWIEHDY